MPAARAQQTIGDGGAARDRVGIEDPDAVVGEQAGHVVPQPELGVIGIGALERLDRADILGLADIARQGVARDRSGRQGGGE